MQLSNPAFAVFGLRPQRTPRFQDNWLLMYLNFKRMNLRFQMAHAGCLTIRLTERSTVRLTGSLFVTVRLTERSTMRFLDGPRGC